MFELISVSIVCATILVSLFAVLHYFKAYRTERSDWLAMIKDELTKSAIDHLAASKKDMETLHQNQLNLAKEVELVKKTSQVRTTLSRPPGSLV